MSDSYWNDPCPRCGHARKWHGEGGCNSEPGMLSFLLGRSDRSPTKCGCAVNQGAIRARNEQ